MKHLLRILFLSLISLTAFATVHQINSGMFFYSPNELTINIGDTVVWINDGGTHDVNGNISSISGESFGNPESFDSPSTSTVGATIYTHVFDIAGTYNYDCSVGNHALQGMTGTIIVEGSNGTVVDIVVNSDDLNTLQTAVIQADLADILSGDGPFTVFAPTDAAFDALPDGVLDQVLANNDVLTAILLHHVHSGNVLSSNLSDEMQVPTLNEDILTVSIDSNIVMIDMSTVTVADIVAENGVVHVIDMVLLPEVGEVDSTVWSIIEFSPIHTTLEAAIIAADLDGALSGDGPFTVFAPTDDAFDALPAGTVDALLADIPQLNSILLHHVHPDNALEEDLMDGMGIPTMNDDILFVNIDGSSVMIGMANVIQTDIEADNGVVHIIDMVLIPDTDPTGVETLFEGQDVEYLHTINLLGELVDRNSKEKILVDIYSNGRSIKRYNLRK